jgi:ankyrin repeat protein
VKECRKEIVSVLLEHKADANIQNSDSNTPLHVAVKGNRTEIAQLLLEKDEVGSFKWDIDINIGDGKGKKA